MYIAGIAGFIGLVARSNPDHAIVACLPLWVMNKSPF